ncbi:hypothetical protein AYI94_20215 [Shewanella algae]|nr:hypothetical protein AYI94_20215 [Shewanella algae]
MYGFICIQRQATRLLPNQSWIKANLTGPKRKKATLFRWLLYLIGRLAMASFEQALRVRLAHQTEFDKRDNLTLLHMGLCLTAFGLFIFPM